MTAALRRTPVRAAIAVAFVVLAAATFIGPDGGPRHFLDADVYAAGARRLLDGLPLYDGAFPTSSGVRLPFTYPPFAALAFAPMALLPLPVTFAAMAAATFGSLWWVLQVIVVKLGGLGRTDAGWLALALTAALLWFGPIHTTIMFGQINVVLMMLVAIDVLAVPPRYRGLLTGAAVALKLTPAVFGLWFLLRRDWPGLARMAASAGGLTLAGHVAAPADSAAYWTSVLADTGRIGGPGYASNQSIDGALWRLGLRTADGGGLIWLVLVAAALAATVAVMRALLDDAHPFLALGANALFGLLASPVSWSHHWVWVPVIAVASVAVALRSGAPGAVRWGWVIAVSALVCFALEPQAVAPSEAGRELEWSPAWHVAGNAYLWWGVAALPMLRELSRKARTGSVGPGSGQLESFP